MPGIGIIGGRFSSGGGSSANLGIGVFSDAGATIPIVSADFGDTVYIKLTVVGITPTNYRFFICENNVNFDLIEQASNIYAKTISTFNDLVIYGEAEDGSIAACALDATTLTINADVDANAFIAAHNAASGQFMATLQQEVIQGTFQRLKGLGTTFGSDLWTKLHDSNSEVYPFAPVSDSTVSASACAIDMIDPSVSATFTNFTLTDFDVTGITGGSTKYLEMKRAPSDFGQNDFGLDTYSCQGASGFGSNVAIGATTSDINSSGANIYVSSNYGFYCLNGVSDAGGNTDGLGLISSNRKTAANLQLYKRGILLNSKNSASQTQTSNKLYGFANNSNGTSERNITLKQAMLCARCSLTDNEIVDWNDVWEYYQTNIITGGRNV